MTPSSFYQLPEKQQIAALEKVAQQALIAYGLKGASLSPLAYRENMTFSVNAGAKGRFALRVHQAGYRTDAQVQSELDFMELVASAGVRTPEVIRAQSGASFVYANHTDVDVPRQCDVFEWIEGKPFRRLAEPPGVSVQRACDVYCEVGRQVGIIYNTTESWERPEGFDRPAWDFEGICGVRGHLGNFREIQGISHGQRRLLNDLDVKLREDLERYGKSPDRFGLTQADLLPENIMICRDGIRLIDFDDTGESWILFEVATAIMDLAGTEFFDPCLRAIVSGFRERRDLPDEHLEMLPAFMVARMLSYLAHTATRDHLDLADSGQQMMLSMLEQLAPSYLER